MSEDSGVDRAGGRERCMIYTAGVAASGNRVEEPHGIFITEDALRNSVGMTPKAEDDRIIVSVDPAVDDAPALIIGTVSTVDGRDVVSSVNVEATVDSPHETDEAYERWALGWRAKGGKYATLRVDPKTFPHLFGRLRQDMNTELPRDITKSYAHLLERPTDDRVRYGTRDAETTAKLMAALPLDEPSHDDSEAGEASDERLSTLDPLAPPSTVDFGYLDPQLAAEFMARWEAEHPEVKVAGTQLVKRRAHVEAYGGVWCDTCESGFDPNENHHHCHRCGGRTSMMGHMNGCPTPLTRDELPAPATFPLPTMRDRAKQWLDELRVMDSATHLSIVDPYRVGDLITVKYGEVTMTYRVSEVGPGRGASMVVVNVDIPEQKGDDEV